MRSDQTDRLKPILRVELAFIACVISAVLFTPHVCCQTPEKDKTQTPPKDKTQTPPKDNKTQTPPKDKTQTPPKDKTQTPPKDKTQTPPKVQGTVEVGGQTRDTQGGHPAKFQEVQDVPKGFFVQKLRLDFNSADSPYVLAMRGFEIRELDQRFTVDGWRVGKYRTQFVWDQIPHYFGTGQSFLQKTAPGVYQVSPTMRASLQAVTLPDTVRTPPNAALPTLVRQELRTAPLTEVRLRRDQALFRQSYQPSDKVELHVQFSRLRNRGSRPMSAGTFVRRPVPGNGLPDIGGSWEGIGQEFLEPLDHRTTEFKVGAQFRGERWNAGVDYDLSLFRNRIGSLIFENPFRVTDEQGCTPNPANPAAPTCGASNRFRMVRWQSDLAPNNDSHTVSFWANADLTPHTQLRGLFSLAYWTQDDAFLPWTLNTAIVPKNWDATSPINNPTDVRELPASSLNGKMRNINQDYALVNRSKNFRFQAQYRSQDLDSQTTTLEFPGYAAFGDSTWRAARTDFYNLPIENLDWDFTRQNVTAGFQWDVLPQLTWKMDYAWEIWNRKFRDVNRNDEHSLRGRLDLTTGAGVRFKADYRYSDRRARFYNTQPLTFNAAFPGSPANGPTTAWEVTRNTVMYRGLPIEFNLLRRFDETGRIRNDASFTIETSQRSRANVSATRDDSAASPGAETASKFSRANFSATYRYVAEAYDKNFYGRTFNQLSFVDSQFSYAFENGNFFFASYSRETNRLGYRDLAHLLPNPPAPPGAIVQGVLAQFPIANTWERNSRSSLDSFEVGINAAPQEGKLQLDLSYALPFARDRISTANPFTVRADSVLHAGANPYPDTVVRRQDINIAISRQIREGIDIGVRYWYEPYTQDDFSFNVLQPYVHGTITSDAPKYLFQDARYASYHANVFTIFLRYSF